MIPFPTAERAAPFPDIFTCATTLLLFDKILRQVKNVFKAMLHRDPRRRMTMEAVSRIFEPTALWALRGSIVAPMPRKVHKLLRDIDVLLNGDVEGGEEWCEKLKGRQRWW